MGGFPPPPTGHGRKGQKVAWTLGARGAGGRTGSAPIEVEEEAL